MMDIFNELQHPPPLMITLTDERIGKADAKHYLRNSIRYNSLLQMGSLHSYGQDVPGPGPKVINILF